MRISTSPTPSTAFTFKQLAEGRIEAEINTKYDGGEFHKVYAEGNGRLNAVSNAIKKAYNLKFDLMTYQEHALSQSSSSKAIAYVGLKKPDGSLSWEPGWIRILSVPASTRC